MKSFIFLLFAFLSLDAGYLVVDDNYRNYCCDSLTFENSTRRAICSNYATTETVRDIVMIYDGYTLSRDDSTACIPLAQDTNIEDTLKTLNLDFYSYHFLMALCGLVIGLTLMFVSIYFTARSLR